MNISTRSGLLIRHLITIVIIGVYLFQLAKVIPSGQLTYQGDSTSRAIFSKIYSEGLYDSQNSFKSLFLEIHSSLDTIVKGNIYTLSKSVNDELLFLNFLKLFNLFIWGTSVFLLVTSMNSLMRTFFFLALIPLFFSSGVINHVSSANMGENLSMLFFTLSFSSFVKLQQRGSYFHQVVFIASAFCAILIRKEILVPVLLLYFYSFLLKKSKLRLVFSAIIVTFPLWITVIYPLISGEDGFHYGNYTKLYEFPKFTVLNILEMPLLKVFINDTGAVTIFLYFFILLFHFLTLTKLKVLKTKKLLVDGLFIFSFIFIMGLGLAGQIHQAPRVLFAVIIFFFMALSNSINIGIDYFYANKIKHQRFAKISVLAISFFILPNFKFVEKYLPDIGFSEATSFLNVKNSESRIVVDRLFYWDFMVMLNLIEGLEYEKVCTYEICITKRNPYGEFSTTEERMDFQVNQVAQYIKDEKKFYFFGQGKKVFDLSKKVVSYPTKYKSFAIFGQNIACVDYMNEEGYKSFFLAGKKLLGKKVFSNKQACIIEVLSKRQ